MPGNGIKAGEPIPLIHRTGVTTECVYESRRGDSSGMVSQPNSTVTGDLGVFFHTYILIVDNKYIFVLDIYSGCSRRHARPDGGKSALVSTSYTLGVCVVSDVVCRMRQKVSGATLRVACDKQSLGSENCCSLKRSPRLHPGSTYRS